MRSFIRKLDTASRKLCFPLLLLCVLISSCSTLSESTHYQRSEAVCLPSFPDRDGWYGGDGAYSVKLDQERVLWLFGDTFVSDEKSRRDRAGMKIVLGTTLAISTCTPDGAFQIRYSLKRRKGNFISFFNEKEWLWPQDPFIVDHVLYVPLISVKSNPMLAGPFKFEIAGHKIARITNFGEADPNQWTSSYIDLTPELSQSIKAFATTSVVYQNYVYFYPLFRVVGNGLSIPGNILARIPINKLENPVRAIEYLTKEGDWEKELNPAKVKIVLDAAVSELSVRYHPDYGKWIAVYMSLRNNGDQMLYQMADAPEGPWTEPRALIESIPEVDGTHPRYDRNNFCYAGKEHAEFARGSNLVVTYVCNSYDDFEKEMSFIRKNLFLYRPVVKKIQIDN